MLNLGSKGSFLTSDNILKSFISRQRIKNCKSTTMKRNFLVHFWCTCKNCKASEIFQKINIHICVAFQTILLQKAEHQQSYTSLHKIKYKYRHHTTTTDHKVKISYCDLLSKFSHVVVPHFFIHSARYK